MMKENKLIAEFMGLIRYSEQHDGMYCAETMELGDFPILFQDNQYNTSWDSLMPVVKKCFDTRQLLLISNLSFLTMDIDVVYDRVVEFIKTYNDEKN